MGEIVIKRIGSLQPIIYDEYMMTIKEKIRYGSIGIIGIFILGIIFYNHMVLALIVAPIGLAYVPYKRSELIKIRKDNLREQFKEALYALSSSVGVGRSIESAFIQSLNDLRIIYGEKDAYIITELEYIVRKITMNETIEQALLHFAGRANIEDITNFTNVFITAKRTGGNLVRIMKYTSSIINEKIDVMNNIEVIITQKKYEQKILALILPIIIIYLNLFSSGFIDVMYLTLTGRVVMTIALLLYILSFIMGRKIVDIEV